MEEGRSRSAPPGTPRNAARSSCPSIRTARTSRSSRPACATAPGMTIQPATSRLVVRRQRARRLGDDMPFDYATEVKEGGVLRLALVLHRRQRGPAPEGERPGPQGQGDRAGRAVPGALGAAADRLLSTATCSRPTTRATPSSPCTARGTAATAPATRSSACCSRQRQADRRVRGLHDRLRGRRRGGVGPAGRRRGRARTARCSSPRTAAARSGA